MGLGRTAVPPGPTGRLVLSAKEAYNPTTGTAVQITRVIFDLEPGCNPVVPFSDFHEALAGPADGTRTTALQKTKFRYGLLRRCFFAPTRPPLLKTINEKD